MAVEVLLLEINWKTYGIHLGLGDGQQNKTLRELKTAWQSLFSSNLQNFKILLFLTC